MAACSYFLLVVLVTGFSCALAQRIGDSCPASYPDPSFCPPNAVCDYGGYGSYVCRCSTGYTPSADNTECIAAPIGHPCGFVDGCPSYASCSGPDNLCLCIEGYTALHDNTACRANVETRCEWINGALNCIPNATCREYGQPCFCLATFVASEDNTVCLPKTAADASATQDKGENTADYAALVALSASTAAVVLVFVIFIITCVAMLATGILKFRGKEEQPTKQPMNLAITLHPQRADNNLEQGLNANGESGKGKAKDDPLDEDYENPYNEF